MVVSIVYNSRLLTKSVSENSITHSGTHRIGKADNFKSQTFKNKENFHGLKF